MLSCKPRRFTTSKYAYKNSQLKVKQRFTFTRTRWVRGELLLGLKQVVATILPKILVNARVF